MVNIQEMLLLKRFELYNNIATLEGNEGRLRVEMVIDPYPRIEWDFEVLGKDIHENPTFEYKGNLTGYKLELQDAYGILKNPYASASEPNYAYIGTSASAYTNEWNNTFRYVTALIPNARCVVKAMMGGLKAEEYRMLYKTNEKPELSSLFPSRSLLGGWECALNNSWTIRITFSEECRKWLEAKDSQGALLAVQGEMVYTGDKDNTLNKSQPMPTLMETRGVLERLCDYLSFANGGYIGPVVVKAKEWTEPRSEAALYGAYLTTPIELLGDTWLTLQCNLCDYLVCFPAFEQMMQSAQWKELYELILIWYFQAIQPSFAQLRGKHWQVSIVALATLLERLTYEIGFELLGQKIKGKPQEKLKFILRTIGITKSIRINDDEEIVDLLYELRNDAIHPRQSKVHSAEEINLGFDYATLWVEEIMLWRLGYKGKYRMRFRRQGNYTFDAPRYDIRTRHASWI